MKTFEQLIDDLSAARVRSQSYAIFTELPIEEAEKSCEFKGFRREETKAPFRSIQYKHPSDLAFVSFKVTAIGQRQSIYDTHSIRPKTMMFMRSRYRETELHTQLACEVLSYHLGKNIPGIYNGSSEQIFEAGHLILLKDEKDKWMRTAMAYAKESEGFPKVGAVLVKDGKQVSFGYRQRINIDRQLDRSIVKNTNRYIDALFHAEQIAIINAGDNTENCDLYVTLEPCNKRINTNSQIKMDGCIDYLLRAGINRVIFGIEDPNPHIHRDLNKLRNGNVQVIQYSNGLEKQLRGLLVDHHNSWNIQFGTETVDMYGAFKPNKGHTKEIERTEKEEQREKILERKSGIRKRIQTKEPEQFNPRTYLTNPDDL